jgi:DNA-binding FrmR family transcriptional regulator
MDSTTKKQVINRLRSVEGHVRGIERMVEEDAYCIDVIKQGIAVQRALERVNGIMLESHLQSCVTTAIRGEEPEERERVIGELLGLFETRSSL